uniref:Uncharacterized protein n=1 Tax=Solanum lycopersicum TaxID=4081 RepID=A0A3Q7EC18_SOLLC
MIFNIHPFILLFFGVTSLEHPSKNRAATTLFFSKDSTLNTHKKHLKPLKISPFSMNKLQLTNTSKRLSFFFTFLVKKVTKNNPTTT